MKKHDITPRHKSIMVLSLLAISFATACIATFSNMDATINLDDETDHGNTQIRDVTTSDISSTDVETRIDYDMKWKNYKQTNVISFSPRIASHYLSYFKNYFDCHGSVNFFRVLAYSTVGSSSDFHVINATSNDFDRNYTYWDYGSIGIGYNYFQQGVEIDELNYRLHAVGINPSNSSDIIADVVILNLTGSTPSIVPLKSTQIHLPSIAEATTGIVIAGMEVTSYDSRKINIYGKYVNNSITNIPFVYSIEYNIDYTIATVSDVMMLNSSSYWMNFDDIILKTYDLGGGIFKMVTNERFMHADIPQTMLYINYTLPFTLSYSLRNDFSNIGLWETPGDYYQDLSFVVITKLELSPTIITKSVLITWNETALSFDPNVQGLEVQYGILSRILPGNTILSTVPDFSDGVYVFGIDHEGNVWNTYSITTGDVSPYLFDLYFPYEMLEVTPTEVELVFADSRGLWIAQFTNELNEVFSIGSVDFDYMQLTIMEMSHQRGVDYFEIVAYGSIHRSATDAVQYGVIPYTISFPSLGIGFSTTEVSYFFQEEVITSPIQNFQGYMTGYADFFVKFKCSYAPIFSSSLLNGTILDASISFVAYEIYGNGTYSQAYMDGTDVRSAVLKYEYSLETAIQIEDSHLLNELHVFAGDTEYDPYSFYFTSPTEIILMSDKITGVVLFNDSMTFTDPLIVNVASKYEFSISYFSTLDKFGFSFDLVDTFVNGTEVNTESVRVLSPDAIITVKDFSGSLIKNVTINKYINGTYIKIGLPLAQVIISNQFSNTTVDFFLEKDGTQIYFQIPASTGFILRLALGEYRYSVYDAENGDLLYDKNVTIDAAKTISFGFTSIDIPEIPALGYTFLDTLISIGVFVVLVFVVMLGYNVGYFKKLRNIFTVTKRS